MPRRAASITQADVARAIRGARAAGLHVRRVVVKGDGVELVLAEGPAPETDAPEGDTTADSARPEMIL